MTTLDQRFFTHNRLAIYYENVEKGLPNEFGIEDIKGAVATIVIARNDTVSLFVVASHRLQFPLSLSRVPVDC